MTIGEDHPTKKFNGKMYRKCYGNKWLQLRREKIPNAYYEGERDDDGLLVRGSFKYDAIVFFNSNTQGV